ncbi:unnamed protein product [Caenorhabditis bovis]|uniref:Uncharacterized protein n=1 Tax=Caenorhabditis bovis TaxID=2654633 RepID=A0A8S1EZK3_9PELO|nr:unnamed protein product [Caenorhabditis bovis]
MGQSQSYDLKDGDYDEKGPVRGVRRISKETQSEFKTYEINEFQQREEEELRERIRNQRLQERERELMTWRRHTREGRETIIDAFKEAPDDQNHYATLNQPNRTPLTYEVEFQLFKHPEVNDGHYKKIDVKYDSPPMEDIDRRQESLKSDDYFPEEAKENIEKDPNGNHYIIHKENYQQELQKSPIEVPTYYDAYEMQPPTAVSEIHAEKRMFVELSETSCFAIASNPDPTYSAGDAQENHHRHPEVEHVPHFTKKAYIHYSVKNTEGESDYQTHIEIPDSQEQKEIIEDSKENLPKNTNAIQLSHDGEIGPMKSLDKPVHEEKLFYHSYMPTISLEARPPMTYYKKLA